MKLYEFTGGLYPPRVGIYLAEKGIPDIERVAFDMFAWPPPEMERLGPLGTVPILETDDGTLIRSSMAIIEYLEELHPSPAMIGASPERRAATRVLVGVVEDASLQFGIWVHKESRLFAGHEPQNPVAAAFAADAYHGRLRKLDLLAAETSGPFIGGENVTIADCALMALLQFAEGFYEVPVPVTCPNLRRWYAMFSRRPSAAAPVYPDHIVERARVEPPDGFLAA